MLELGVEYGLRGHMMHCLFLRCLVGSTGLRSSDDVSRFFVGVCRTLGTLRVQAGFNLKC